METFITNLIATTLLQVWTSFSHNWPFLLISVVIATALKLYLDPQKVSAFLLRYRSAGVIGATVAAVTTPLCSCGTTAVLLGMMASMMPWAPVIAFMVASPLTSPEELIYSAGLFGWPFAMMFFLSSIVLGLAGGVLGSVFENRGWLKNQTRFSNPVPMTGSESEPEKAPASSAQPVSCACSTTTAPVKQRTFSSETITLRRPVLATSAAAPAACGCGGPAPIEVHQETCGCSAEPDTTKAENRPAPKVTLRIFLEEAFTTGKRLLLMFIGFAFIGYLLNGLIPQEWVAAIFGSGNVYSVPLAATLGLPLYVNTEASLPLVRALMDGGMSQGAAMAFLITGSGTSIGAVAGALTIARWRVIALVIGTLWVGAIVMGFLYNFILTLGII